MNAESSPLNLYSMKCIYNDANSTINENNYWCTQNANQLWCYQVITFSLCFFY